MIDTVYWLDSYKKLNKEAVKNLKKFVKIKVVKFLDVIESEKEIEKMMKEIWENYEIDKKKIEYLNKLINFFNIINQFDNNNYDENKDFYDFLKKLVYFDFNDDKFIMLYLTINWLYLIIYDLDNLFLINLSCKENWFHIFNNWSLCEWSWKNLIYEFLENDLFLFFQFIDNFLVFDDKVYHLAKKWFNMDFMNILEKESKILILNDKVMWIDFKNIKDNDVEIKLKKLLNVFKNYNDLFILK